MVSCEEAALQARFNACRCAPAAQTSALEEGRNSVAKDIPVVEARMPPRWARESARAAALVPLSRSSRSPDIHPLLGQAR